jgi:uncharacterized protein
MTPASARASCVCVAIKKDRRTIMHAFPVDIGTIAEEHGASLAIAGELAIEELVLGEDRYVLQGPATFEVTITDTGTAYIAYGTARATVRAECSRCLAEFDLPLEGEVDVYFVVPAHADEVPEEQDWALVDGGRVDLGPFVESALAVALPLAPVCEEECAGICPACGADLNTEECTCEPPAEPHPFASLGGLLEQLESGNDETPGKG